MEKISFEYWNELTTQFLLINSLLAGFSITIVATLLVYDSKSKIVNTIFRIATFSVLCFIVAIFANTTLKMMTTTGYPLEFKENKFFTARVVAGVSFLLGIISMISMMSLSGWVKSKKIGWFTTLIGVVAFIIIMVVQ